jgi:hypothetical protein
MRRDYEAWLRARGYDEGTITAQLHRCGRVEQHYGDLDRHYAGDRLAKVLDALRYSTEDERRAQPNSTPLPIKGVLRTNLASYRNAVQRYGAFCAAPLADRQGAASAAAASLAAPPIVRQVARAAPSAQLPPKEHARTLADFGFDGQEALATLIASSRYATLAQAVASLAVFSHPQTVAQTQGLGLFPTIRGTPGQFVEVNGRRLMLDDNKSPTDAFLWCNGLSRRGRDTQFNHVYAASTDPEAYTALPNICMTPAFLAKLTDTNAEVRALLAYRSHDLYGWAPAGTSAVEKPEGYAALEWAPPLPAVTDVQERLRTVFARRQKDRTVLAAQALGWRFAAAPEAI